MKIDRVDAWICHFPFPEGHPFSPSWVPGLTTPNSSCVIYRFVTDTGLEGYTSCPAFVDEGKGPINLLRAFLVGQDPTNPRIFKALLEAATDALGLRVWHIETALYDLAAKAAELPLYRYLGGTRDRLRAYASFGEVREPKQRADDALQALEAGFQAVKLRPRHDTFEQDVTEVRTVREAVGDRLGLAADANQGWRVDLFKPDNPRWDFKRALATARAYEEFDVLWLEEPLHQFDFEGYKALRSQTTTRIAGAELVGQPWVVREFIERRALDIIQPDCILTAGVTGCLELAAAARMAGLGFAPHTWNQAGIGMMANYHVAAATHCEWLEYPYDPPSFVVETRDAMLTEPIRIDAGGWIRLPKGPGLGIELDIEKIEAHGEAI